VRLAHTYSPERLERAGARALHFGAADYVTVKRILQAGLDQQPLPPAPRHPPAHQRYTFVRQASEFVASLLGASTWGGNR
jgi:hypothetical protein